MEIECTNCGNKDNSSNFLDGCPYCGTFFKMEDLFPKTTNFFMIKDHGYTEKEIKGNIFKTMLL